MAGPPVRRAYPHVHRGADRCVRGGVVDLRRPPALGPISANVHRCTCGPGGAAGLRARPELHLGAAQPVGATTSHRHGDENGNANTYSGDDAAGTVDTAGTADIGDNCRVAAALWVAALCSAAAIRSAHHHDDTATSQPAARAPDCAPTRRLGPIARLAARCRATCPVTVVSARPDSVVQRLPATRRRPVHDDSVTGRPGQPGGRGVPDVG
jgi:hypothetical protein